MADRSQNTLFHITFLRHGQSTGNLEGRVQGRSEFPLSDTGRKQALALGKRWQAERRHFDWVISSPQSRSRETAEIIAACLDLEVEFDEHWVERDYGNLSGMVGEEAERAEQRPLYAMPYQPVGQVGESLWDLFLRAGHAVHSLMQRDPGRYLIVSHGGILNMVLYNILGIAPQAYFRGARFAFRNTAFATLTYHPTEHIWRVVGLNDRAHWPSDD
jgi:broad specificity phosphatase PhoE